MRRGAMVAAAAVLTVAAVLGLLAFFNSRDDATIGERGGDDTPGQPAPEATRDELKRGNVVLHFARAGDAEPLRKLAREFGPESLARDGQAVLVRRTPGTDGVVAEAYRRRLEASGPEDRALRPFIDHWLGRGAVP